MDENKIENINKRIQQLTPHLADQIAAGEVIERPASVLKELMENSIDAGSTQIEVSIERGGIGLIKVQDNGSGICKEDLKLAIAPHATSKIASLADLEQVISYGFRGEALASISSVSRLRLSSFVKDQEFGWCIERAGRDNNVTLMPASKNPGTQVEVRDLFFNTPARRHFLRSEKTEMNYIEEVFKRIALSQPKIAFKLQQGEQLQKRLPICNSVEAESNRVAMLCGQSFIDKSYQVQVEANGLSLKGWLGSAAAMRGQADLQYFYVNGRIVRDKVVMHAIRQAYQDICLPGRYPAYVLFFNIDPAAVDVNVHPTKHEVRFREARMVHAFLSYAITEGLKQGQTQGKEAAVLQADLLLENSLQAEFVMRNPALKETAQFTESKQFAASPKAIEQNIEHKPRPEGMDFSFLRDAAKFSEYLDHNEGPYRHSKPMNSQNQKAALGKFIGVIAKDFLLAIKDQSLVMVDIKATRRFLLRRELSEAYQAEGVSTRPLLMPKSFSIGKNPEVLENAVVDWHKLGFDITQMGHDLVLVRSVPGVLASLGETLTELLPKLLKLKNLEEALDLMVETIVQAESLSEDELKQLLFEIPKLEAQNLSLPGKLYQELPSERLKALF